MKNIFKSLFVLVLLIVFSGCEKTFLERVPTENITAEQLQEASETNPKIAKGMVSGIYSTMIETFSALGEGHDDFGQKSADIATDILSGDMALENEVYSWFDEVAKLQTTATDRPSELYWKYYFRVIKAANEVIDASGGNDAMPEDLDVRAYFGQAKALRAHAYFSLVNLYGHNYSDYSSIPCLPLYDYQLDAVAKPLSSISKVYEMIIADLQSAISALEGYNRSSKTEINSDVAKGLLAYAYLTTGQNTEAALLAGEVIGSENYTLMSATEIIESGFRDLSIPGWMWGVDLTTDNTGMLLTVWGMIDIFTYSYAGVGDTKGMDDNLYNMIPDNDVRKGQFTTSFFYTNDHLPIWKFWDKKRVIFGDRSWTNDEVYMRVAEMYLIQAEALSRSGDDPGARTALLGLIADREPGAEARLNTLSGDDLLNEIYLQWRIEMWGEGKAYWALKRFKGTVHRGMNHFNMANTSYQHDDPRIILSIPEDEINNNPMLSVPTKKAPVVSSEMSYNK